MQKNFIRNTIKCNCTPTKIRYNVLLCARLPQHSTDTGTRDSTATSAPHLISIQKPKMCHLIFHYYWRRAGACPLVTLFSIFLDRYNAKKAKNIVPQKGTATHDGPASH